MSLFRLGLLVGCLVLASPALAETAPPAPSPAAPPAAKPADPFGEEITLAAKPMVVVKGTATWDKAFDTLIGAYKTVLATLQKQGLKPAGPATTIYSAMNDSGFEFMAGFAVAEEPKAPLPPEVVLAKSPAGKALKFIHRGSYETIDTTYDAITRHFEAKNLDAADSYVEQYLTNPLTTPEDYLVIEIDMLVK